MGHRIAHLLSSAISVVIHLRKLLPLFPEPSELSGVSTICRGAVLKRMYALFEAI